MKMNLTQWIALAVATHLQGESIYIPSSISPDGRIAIILDIDRDPTIEYTWKEDGFPKLEITDLDSEKVIGRIEYRGEPVSQGDEAKLRRTITTQWRNDSRALAITFDLTRGCTSMIAYQGKNDSFNELELPTWQSIIGGPIPGQSVSGCNYVEDWDEEGNLIVNYFLRYSRPEFGPWEIFDYCVWVQIIDDQVEVMNFEKSEQ